MSEHSEMEIRTGDSSALQAPADLRPLANRSMFWRPVYLAPSAWTEHVPFAFWLVEAHRPRVFVELGTHFGTSYFGFCQAVDRLNLDTQCFAVDTWKGDEHAGEYDEHVYRQVEAHNEAHYSGFSRLVRSTFDEALEHFTDGTVDLLHIDGLHTLEAVTHDFESWLPKLSPRAIVVFHDTNVRERGFGVFKLFEQLAQRYPVFEFVHGHGLGVVGVGADALAQESVEQLFQANTDPVRQRAVREVFSRLGRACADAFKVLEARKVADQAGELQRALDEARRTLDVRTTDLGAARSRLEALSEKYASERGQWVERLSGEQTRSTELQEDLTRLRQELLETTQQRIALEQQAHALAEANKQLEQRRSDFAALSEQLRHRERAFEELRVQSAQRIEAVSAAGAADAQRAAARIRALESALGQRDEQLATSKRSIGELTSALEASRRQIAELSRSRSWRLTAPLRWAARPFSGGSGVSGEAVDPADDLVALLDGSVYFDGGWYLQQYPDVAAAGADPIRHYLESGAEEGRDPSPRFSTRAYLDRYPDVGGTGVNPLVHFLRFGLQEGRSAVAGDEVAGGADGSSVQDEGGR